MSNILKSTVGTPFRRHRDKQPSASTDNFQPPDYKRVIESYIGKSFQSLFVPDGQFDLGDLHWTSPQDISVPWILSVVFIKPVATKPVYK